MRLRRAAAALAGLLLAGCAAPLSNFVPSSSTDGVVSWRRGSDLLVARVSFQSAAGEARRIVVVAKDPLLVLTRRGGEWSAAGSLAHGHWCGPENTAPVALAGWLNLAEAFEGAASASSGDSDMRTGRFSVRYQKNGAELRSLELVTVVTGDRFRVTFSPAPAR